MGGREEKPLAPGEEIFQRFPIKTDQVDVKSRLFSPASGDVTSRGAKETLSLTLFFGLISWKKRT